jgi:phosphopantothenoylcysteine decarboxylase / phosphopantothenate---cysteine ligase
MSHADQAMKPPSIVVGVTGGIAAYKAVTLVRELVRGGADVTVIPTASALKFVGLPTWEAISRNPVHPGLFDGVAEVRHVALGQAADLVIIAPATAHALAQLAGGFAGDLLGTTVLASSAPLLIAPAMHTEMWENPAVAHNVATLIDRGVHMVGPVAGELTGGDSGVGRMAEPEDISARAFGLLRPQAWAGRKVLISAGGTREALDPVRFIGNRSTGAMGVAIARAALQQGASVTLVHAHLEVPAPSGVKCVPAGTAAQMRDAMVSHASEANLIIMAAAVADWVPENVSSSKISKREVGESWAPVLVRAPDILAELGARKRDDQTLVGFAAETATDPSERESIARGKLLAKKADVILLNEVGDQVGFGDVETAVTIFSHASPQSLLVEGTKTSIADRLLEVLQDR